MLTKIRKKLVIDIAKDADKIVYIRMFGVRFYDTSNLVYMNNTHTAIKTKNVTSYSLASILKAFIADMFGVEPKTKNEGNTSKLTPHNRSLAAAIISTLIALPLTISAIIIGMPALIVKYLAKMALLKIFPNEQYLPTPVAIAASIILSPFNALYALANIVPLTIRTFIQETVVEGVSIVKGRHGVDKTNAIKLTTSYSDSDIDRPSPSELPSDTILIETKTNSLKTSYKSPKKLEIELDEVAEKVEKEGEKVIHRRSSKQLSLEEQLSL